MLFHALGGCDTVSYMYGIGKSTMLNTYITHHKLISNVNVLNPEENDMQAAEIFLCRAYGDEQASSLNQVRARRILTASRPEQLPPTSDAARLHIKRACLQTAKWEASSIPLHKELIPNAEDTEDFQLDSQGRLVAALVTHDHDDSTINLVVCNCQANCQTKRFICFKKGLKCSLMCHKSSKYHSHQCINKNE